MTHFVPSTTVTVQRGESVDAFGDPVDTQTSIATGVPAFITEGSTVSGTTLAKQKTFHPSDQRTTVIDNYTIRLRPTADVQEQDRLLDERNGVTYLVRDVLNPQSAFGFADVRVIAQRVGALSQPVNG